MLTLFLELPTLCIKLFLFYRLLLLKCKISAISLVETAFIFLVFLIATAQTSMECEMQSWIKYMRQTLVFM